jgi:predicted aspartyl protease
MRQLLIGWGALLVVAITVSPPANAASDAPGSKDCTLRQYASLYVLRSTNGAVLIPVLIGDQTVRMWLNSGSATSGMQQWAVERLGLKARPLPLSAPTVTYGSQPIKASVMIPLMALGNARFKDTDLLVLPGGPPADGKQPGPDVPVGFLGMNMFANLDVELDLGHDKINLFSPDHCPGTEVYWTQRFDVVPMRRGHLKDLYFVMQLDGKKMQAKLGTGSDRSQLQSVVAKKSFGWEKSSAEARTMSLGAGGLTVLNVPIYLMASDQCVQGTSVTTDQDGALAFEECYGVYPLYLGTGVLNKLRLYIAAKEQKLYFTAADATAATAPAAAGAQ